MSLATHAPGKNGLNKCNIIKPEPVPLFVSVRFFLERIPTGSLGNLTPHTPSWARAHQG